MLGSISIWIPRMTPYNLLMDPFYIDPGLFKPLNPGLFRHRVRLQLVKDGLTLVVNLFTECYSMVV